MSSITTNPAKFSASYAGAWGYPYYNFYNRHLPANANVYDNQTQNSWSYSAPQYEQITPIFEPAPMRGYWNGYYDYLEWEKKAPWPLTTRRGGTSESQAFAIQTSVYRTPDLALGIGSRDTFFTDITQRALAKAPNVPSWQW